MHITRDIIVLQHRSDSWKRIVGVACNKPERAINIRHRRRRACGPRNADRLKWSSPGESALLGERAGWVARRICHPDRDVVRDHRQEVGRDLELRTWPKLGSHRRSDECFIEKGSVDCAAGPLQSEVLGVGIGSHNSGELLTARARLIGVPGQVCALDQDLEARHAGGRAIPIEIHLRVQGISWGMGMGFCQQGPRRRRCNVYPCQVR